MSEINPRPPELLDMVTTISEVEARWFYAYTTVRRWIDEGRFRARQAGSTWLIEVPSFLLFLAARGENSPEPRTEGVFSPSQRP